MCRDRGRPVGFALVEILVAAVVMAGIALVLAALVRATSIEVRIQPEAGDMQQRLRTALQTAGARLASAGLGSTVGAGAGPLASRVPVVFPQRRTPAGSDGELSAFDDRVTVFGVVPEGLLVPLIEPMASATAPIRLAPVTGCAPAIPSCRFAPGSRALVFDATGAFDVFVVSVAAADTLTQTSRLSHAYDPAVGAAVVPLEVRSLFHDASAGQLRETSGGSTSFPVVDGVAGFSVRYFGSAEAPSFPRPPPGVVGCVYDASGAPSLPNLSSNWGALVELPLDRLRDGPVCGTAPNRFDADLFRVRQLRVTVRIEAVDASFRGRNPLEFVHAGSASSRAETLPDLEVTLDVAPPNLRGGR